MCGLGCFNLESKGSLNGKCLVGQKEYMYPECTVFGFPKFYGQQPGQKVGYWSINKLCKLMAGHEINLGS